MTEPTSGEIIFNDEIITSQVSLRKLVGLCNNYPMHIDYLSIIEQFIYFGMVGFSKM